MSDLHIGIIGIIAGVLTTSSFIPQIIKILSTKKTGDISLIMYIVFMTGMSLWLVYGIFLGELPIILANVAGLVLCLFVILAKLRFDKAER